MKLSDLKDEQAVDALAEMLEPFSRIAQDEEIKNMVSKGKAPLLIFRAALKQHKDDVVAIVAAIHGESPDTYHFNLVSMMKDFIGIFSDKELLEVFRMQGQTDGNALSGSATGNAKEEE